jgi:hypothetical protein
MSQFTRCDGCKREATTGIFEKGKQQLVVHGARTENSGQGLAPLPNGVFDWCEDCGKIAFAAVRDANAVPSGRSTPVPITRRS